MWHIHHLPHAASKGSIIEIDSETSRLKDEQNESQYCPFLQDTHSPLNLHMILETVNNWLRQWTICPWILTNTFEVFATISKLRTSTRKTNMHIHPNLDLFSKFQPPRARETFMGEHTDLLKERAQSRAGTKNVEGKLDWFDVIRMILLI